MKQESKRVYLKKLYSDWKFGTMRQDIVIWYNRTFPTRAAAQSYAKHIYPENKLQFKVYREE